MRVIKRVQIQPQLIFLPKQVATIDVGHWRALRGSSVVTIRVEQLKHVEIGRLAVLGFKNSYLAKVFERKVNLNLHSEYINLVLADLIL